MDQHIERILSHVPGWRGAEAVVTPLLGGITNQNYRVDIAGESFVLRIGGKGTHLLGIDRGRERACTAIAAQMGSGPGLSIFSLLKATRYSSRASFPVRASLRKPLLALRCCGAS